VRLRRQTGPCAGRAPDPLITELQPWQQYLGDGVDARPYGMPSQYEAHVVRRNVPWLTADSVSRSTSRRCTRWRGSSRPTVCAFERHHGGVAEIDPGMHRLMINGLVDTPLVFTMEDLMRFPRENRTYFLECAANTGMEWRGRAAEWLPVHARHDPQRRLYRRAAAGFCWKKRACGPTPHGSCRKARTPRP
jgi:sulfane dehydrogenase subunit SoxC